MLCERGKTMSNGIRYLLGIDGGGTKTEFLLTDSDGNEIRRLFLGNSNPVNQGIENTFNILKEGITKICDDVDMGKISVFAGIAGSKTGENQKLICDFLSDFGFAFSDCGSDIDLALEVALKGENGTCVIMGTGIVAFSRSGKTLQRAGGHGYMIDKGGSGFHFGSDALNSAFRYIDSKDGSETILKLVEKNSGKKLDSSVSEIYCGGPAFVASFAPVIFEAFRMGDPCATKIIERNAHEASKIINSSRKSLMLSKEKIVVCGGLCKQKEILYPYLIKYIDSDAPLAFLDEPMVNGAITLAKRLCENA